MNDFLFMKYRTYYFQQPLIHFVMVVAVNKDRNKRFVMTFVDTYLGIDMRYCKGIDTQGKEPDKE